ncbi:hypothetical protein H3H36_10870 [Duganella sp. FT3S]|uniref:HTH iclR-type domain-containing protein n=1 Tax=Rugamonas fusca TaxID=2758568 RepID=A0A7W2EH92_9BURK|nr:hypothetical protein [Rugamonas fusca]MBA5605861.1 hypothetical protein [Rugamonas fusca]
MSATKNKRKPVEMEMVGGKGSRQIAWEAIRKHSGTFTCLEIAHKTKIAEGTLYTYIQGLEKAGFLTGHMPANATIGTAKKWELARDNGIEAPRLTREGKPIAQGAGTEAMWRSMRIIGEFNFRDLAAYASTSGTPVAEGTAKAYISALNAAGYLVVTKPAAMGKAPSLARYRIAPGKNTGPRAPMIQRTKSVYDPNIAQVVWKDEEKSHDDL